MIKENECRIGGKWNASHLVKVEYQKFGFMRTTVECCPGTSAVARKLHTLKLAIAASICRDASEVGSDVKVDREHGAMLALRLFSLLQIEYPMASK